MKASDSDLYCVIPLSKQVEKYERIIAEKIQKFKSCDILHVLHIANRKNVLLIQDMFPITKEYFLREYTIDQIPLKLLDNKEIRNIEAKAKKVMILLRKGVKFTTTQPDIFIIEKQLKFRLELSKINGVEDIVASSEKKINS